MSSKATGTELNRIRRVYRTKDGSEVYRGQYRPFAEVPFGYLLQRLRALGDLLAAVGVDSLEGRDICDLGCGAGVFLGLLPSFGAEPQRLVGVELMPERLAAAREAYPSLRFDAAPGDRVPLADASCDLVICSVVFSSIHSAPLRSLLAADCARVLRPGGYVFWWDLFHLVDLDARVSLDPKPLFPGWAVAQRQVAWRPLPSAGLSRRLWRYSVGHLADLFATRPTHLAALIGPKQSSR
jgi:SAM-dependent methyltransferase